MYVYYAYMLARDVVSLKIKSMHDMVRVCSARVSLVRRLFR